MAINRNYSSYPTGSPNQRSPSLQVAGDVTGSGVSTDKSNLGCNSGMGTQGTIVSSIPATGTAASASPAADQGYMPAMDSSGSINQPSVPQLLQEIIGMVTTIVQTLVAQSGLSSGNANQLPSTSTLNPNAGLTNPSAGLTDPSASLTDPSTVTGDNSGTTATQGTPAGINNATPDPTQKASLDQSLNQIQTDPAGAKLIAQAQKEGITIEVGDPASAAANAGSKDQTVVPCPFCQAAAKLQAAGDVSGAAAMKAKDTHDGGASIAKDGTVVVNGVTLTDNKTGKVTVVVRDPSNVKTIAHELVHAVTPQDGNSKQEEGIADVIGSHVATNVGDAKDAVQGTDEQIYTNKQQYYPTLQDSNSIRPDLAALGISTDV